jgi:hypothetical protein
MTLSLATADPSGRLKLMRLALVAAACAAAVAVNAQTRTPIDITKLGPQVGERVPDFTLNDQNGRPRTLQSVMGTRGAMLVFIRSADW